MDAFQRDMIELLPRLRRFARALVHARADADDLVQLTLERALSRSESWTPGTRLDSWMFRIMKNAWIDETRARQRKAQVFMPDEYGANVGDDGAKNADRRLEAAAVAREIARLPEDQRVAVALVLVDGLSYKEAAEILEVPQGTLTSRLGRGRATLMMRLAGDAA